MDFLPDITPYIWEYTDDTNLTTADAAVLITEVLEEYDAAQEVVMANNTDTANNADTAAAAATTTTTTTATTTTTTTTPPIEDNVRTRGRDRGRRLRRGGGCTDSHFKDQHSVDRHRHRTRTRTLQQQGTTHNNDPYFQDKQQELDNQVELVKELETELEIRIPSPRNRTFYAPVWEMVPIPIINATHRTVEIINYNLVDRPVFEKATDYMATTRAPTFLDVCDQSAWFLIDGNKVCVLCIVYCV